MSTFDNEPVYTHLLVPWSQVKSECEEDEKLIQVIFSGASTSSGSKTPSTKLPEQSTAQSNPQQPSTVPSSYPEADIKKLMDYGFSRQQVVEELTRAGGNVDQALAALFAKSFQMPSSWVKAWIELFYDRLGGPSVLRFFYNWRIRFETPMHMT